MLEDVDEHLADDLPLLLRVGDARERGEEAVLRINRVEIGLEPVLERVPHDLGLARPHEAVVDVDARHLRADRLEEQRRADARIDAAARARR